MSDFPTCKGFYAPGGGRGQRPIPGQMEKLLEEIGDPRFGAVADMVLFQVDRRCRMFLFRSYGVKPPVQAALDANPGKFGVLRGQGRQWRDLGMALLP